MDLDNVKTEKDRHILERAHVLGDLREAVPSHGDMVNLIGLKDPQANIYVPRSAGAAIVTATADRLYLLSEKERLTKDLDELRVRFGDMSAARDDWTSKYNAEIVRQVRDGTDAAAVDALKQQLEAKETANEQLRNVQAQLHARVAERDQEIEELRSRLGQAKPLVEEVQQRSADIAERIADISNQLTQVKTKSELARRYRKLQKSYAFAEQYRSDLVKDVSQIVRGKTPLTEDEDPHTEMGFMLQAYVDSLRDQIAALENLPTIAGAVSDG